jgi:predicted ATP-binding protein involved in virulence
MVKINNDDELSLEVLSSGEQHEIVLLYDLLFKTEKNALVMIDEPELSLHVSWQKSFVKDLLEIIKIAEFDVILATHSPYIVGKYSNLMVALTSDQHQVAE